ncbi:hypothetical protein AWB77_04748 [Caballeronia fortuita]|uniref:Uncharacterized protein n=1 Tax=Caballeronia fortuita TaxID=1777138 RepID=A0A158D0H8_9BURK|nr:hypothetical protein [Caballeronia fortuita]SAK88078.1 hypothetical protein AWB77_04748 [Caballeronia fortuita]
MQKKRIILAAAIMSMSLIAFMSMANGRVASVFSVRSNAPEQVFYVESGQHDFR